MAIQTGHQARKLQEMIQELTLIQSQILAPTPLAAHVEKRLKIRTGILIKPARDIPGDFANIIEAPDGRLWLYAGDAAGSSLGPAFMGLTAALALRQAIDLGIQDPVQVILHAANAIHSQIHGRHFATATAAAITRRGRSLQIDWAVAGHAYPISLSPHRKDTLTTTNKHAPNGVALGMTTPEKTYPASGMSMIEPNGIFLITTDGISDHMDDALLRRTVAKARRKIPMSIAKQVLESVNAHKNLAGDPDDQTVLVLRNEF